MGQHIFSKSAPRQQLAVQNALFRHLASISVVLVSVLLPDASCRTAVAAVVRRHWVSTYFLQNTLAWMQPHMHAASKPGGSA